MELGETILELRTWGPEKAPAHRSSSVFILDDNPADVTVIRQSLRESRHRKYECQVATSLADALWQLDDVKPNVVLMALELSGSDGLYGFQKIRQMLPSTPIIVYSDLDEPDLGEALIREGAQDFITTQMILVPGVLGRIIQHAVQRERTREALRNASHELTQRRGQLEKTTQALQEARLSLVDAERMRTIGRLAAGVAHEVKNPLAVIRLSLDFLRSKLGDDAVVEKVMANLYDAVERANKIIMGMLDFGAPKPLSKEDVEVKFMVLEAFNLTEHAMMKHHVDFTMDLPDDLPMVLADYDKCVQVLINLLLNACHAIKQQGSIVVRASVVPMRTTPEDGSVSPTVDALELMVEDSGPGIPEDVLPQLFEPFFTTKEKEGTGLGLCVARMIMQMHGGDLAVENRVEGGARFRMFWPLKGND